MFNFQLAGLLQGGQPSNDKTAYHWLSFVVHNPLHSIAYAMLAIAAFAALKTLRANLSLKIEKRALMTERERHFMTLLEAACPNARIHAQVSMGALIKPISRLSAQSRLWTLRRYNQKIVDYVIEDRRTGRVILIVELDDRTHRFLKDLTRDYITRRAGYKTLRIRTARKLDVATLRLLIVNAIKSAAPVSKDTRRHHFIPNLLKQRS